MWVVFFNHFSDLDILAKELKGFERFYSPSDGVLFRSKRAELPIAFAATESSSQQNLFDWIYKSFHPQTVISSGLIQPSPRKEHPEVIVPKICFRAAGRVDASSPLLYEDIAFDPGLQSQLAQHFGCEVAGSLFAANRVISDAEERDRICEYLGCDGFGQVVGEHLLLAKARGLRVGAVKAFVKEKQSRTPLIKELLEKFQTFKI